MKYCEECGATLDVVCPACGASVPTGKKFCGACGAALAAPVPLASPAATARLFEAKRRPPALSLPVLAATAEEAWDVASEHSRKVHITYKDRPFHTILSCAPPCTTNFGPAAKRCTSWNLCLRTAAN